MANRTRVPAKNNTNETRISITPYSKRGEDLIRERATSPFKSVSEINDNPTYNSCNNSFASTQCISPDTVLPVRPYKRC
jgi:hypothetical protein